MKRDRLRKLEGHQKRVKKEILELEAVITNPGSGFGDPDARQDHLSAIQFKKDEEARLARDINGLLIRKIKKRQSLIGWLSAIAAICSALAAILQLFNFKIL